MKALGNHRAAWLSTVLRARHYALADEVDLHQALRHNDRIDPGSVGGWQRGRGVGGPKRLALTTDVTRDS
jgi:hypothetical protein